MTKNKNLFLGKLAYLIFWGYNLLFAIFLLFVIIQILYDKQLSLDIFTFGHAPLNVLVMLYGFIAIPFISMPLVWFTKLRKQPTNILKLFLGVQIPLMGLAVIRITFFRQVTPIVWIFFISIVASVAGLFIHLLYPKINSKYKETLLMLSQQVALLLTSYVFLLAFFFLPIILAYLLKDYLGIRYMLQGLGNELVYDGILMFLLSLVGTIFFLLTASFFIFGPIGALITFWKTCSSLYKNLVHNYGLHYSRLTRYGLSILFIFVIVLLSIQANANSYTNIISQYRNATTFEERQQIGQQLLHHDKEIRNNLVNSYLTQYRYLSDNKMNILQTGYKNELGANKTTAQFIQRTFNTIALPFIYRGAFEEDSKKAAENYKEIFDNSIQKGELNAITNTLKATNTQDPLQAGMLDLNKKSVKVVHKVITVTPYNDGLLAKVTIEEEYENTTDQPQEVYYEFSLHDDAVITELTLGPDLQFGANAVDKPQSTPTQQTKKNYSSIEQPALPRKENTAVVAPKGAAKNTYEQQIFARQDPALIEQAGPRQYKLRVFPIPVKPQIQDEMTRTDNPEFVSEKNQKLRYSYVTFINPQGIPLPIIQEQRNIANNLTPHYLFNGNQAQTTANKQYLLPATHPCITTQITTPADDGGEIIFIPHASNAKLTNIYSCQNHFSQATTTMQGNHIALLLDSSYSTQKKDWNIYLKKNFPMDALVKNNSVDLFFFNDKVSKKMVLTANTLKQQVHALSIGKKNRLGAIAKLSNTYDAIFMVTDSNAVDAPSEKKSIATTAPIYIIQPENHIPIYNDALTTAILQSGGKVVATGFEAIQNFELQKMQTPNTILDINDYGTWIWQPKRTITPTNNTPDPFHQLAQKKRILSLIRKNRYATSEDLDRLNSLSQTAFIVTPYSSMIVLVTNEQKAQLSAALKENNRYQVAFDIGEEQLANPSGRGILEVSAVPEPHEWLLIIVGSLLLCYLYRRKLQTILQPIYEQSIRKIKKF